MIRNGASTSIALVLGAAILAPSSAFGDPTCWLDPINHQTCCNPAYGSRGNEACWTPGFSFERCCAVDPCFYQLQWHQFSCMDSAPTAEIIQTALKIAGNPELKKYIVVTQIIFEQKNEIGFDPMASTAFLAGERLKGFGGYGEPGHRARIYYELACQSKLLLAHNVLPLCPQLADSMLDHEQTLRKVKLLDVTRLLTSDLFHLGGYLFRVALELVGWWHLSEKCEEQRKHLSQVLASTLQTYWEKMAKALEELAVPQSFAPGMGSTSSIVAERMTSPQLIDFWKKLVEGVHFAPCLDLVLNFVVLVYYIAEETVRLRSHLFAQIYVTELQSRSLPADAPKVMAPVPGQRFIFQQHRCCMRYHALLQLLEEMQKESPVSMIEIGVHKASTAKFLLDRAPFLQWIGIDSYDDYTSNSGSGDRLFQEAQQILVPFGSRARLLRISSSEAWETTGALRGLDEQSVDVLFVDGDHDYNATLNDLRSWSRFVRSGGIISGHDIFNPVNDGVTDAVEELLRGSDTTVRFATDHFYWWYAS